MSRCFTERRIENKSDDSNPISVSLQQRNTGRRLIEVMSLTIEMSFVVQF